MQDIKNVHVLIVDDEVNTLKASAATLKMSGVKNIVLESDSRRVMEIMAGQQIDVVLLDLFMPHISGMEILPLLQQHYPQIPVIVITAAFELERAVECIKMGAFDYLVKPVESERLVTTLARAIEWQVLNEQIHDLRNHLVDNRLDSPAAFDEIITRSSKMRSIFQYIEVVARSDRPVLITGESGTGKELVARAIHRLSGCKGELVSVNLAGLDDAMFSDTLFGHRKGAFTGADQSREGLIVRAAGGVIFMDEIGDLGESSQIRLLRLIQEREFYPVGSDVPRKCEARIVCASNKDIKKLVASGSFRNDLYYRLCVHHVMLPPLRERKEDIPLLVEHFIAQDAAATGQRPLTYPRELTALLNTYNFPGNIRELQGMVIDAVTRRQSGMISLDSFRQLIAPDLSKEADVKPELSVDTIQKKLEDIWGHFPTLREAEDCIIDTALELAGGNQGIAATMLGLKRQTLNMRLKSRSEKENS
jgi:two-component system response regulator HydG